MERIEKPAACRREPVGDYLNTGHARADFFAASASASLNTTDGGLPSSG